MSASPSAVVFGVNQLYVFHRGPGQTGQLWYTATSDGSSWAADQLINGVSASWSPAGVETMGQLDVFYQGGGNNGQLWKYTHEMMEIVGVTYDLNNAVNRDMSYAVLYTQTVPNHSGDQQTTSVSMTRSTQETSFFENSRSAGVSLEVGREFKASIPVVEAEVGGSLKLGLSTSTTRTYGTSTTFSKEYSATVPVTVSPHSATRVTFSVQKCILDVPYTMTLRTKDGYETTCAGVWQGLTSWNLVTRYEPVPL
ncbi:MAG TPA: aerolysin family beta-barrel pore-forming toxin [Polyangiaceae bacterium]|nr:aerolysin family beta-barrel pore-forming toxin [Polyangiaceae bacterium]